MTRVRAWMAITAVCIVLPQGAAAQPEQPGQPPPAAQPATVTQPEQPGQPPPPPAAQPAAASPTVPQPPPSYSVPPPPPGARYSAPPQDAGAEAAASPTRGALKIPNRVSTRLRVLSTDLEALAARGGSNVANGILSIVTGGLSITLGVLFEEDALSTFLYVFGGASIARGIVDLALAPDPSEPALEFTHMPMRDVAEVKLRLHYGERSLSDLASQSRTARLIDGGINIATGVLIVPLVLAPKNFEFEDALDYFVVIGAGISLLSGVITLLTRTDAERRWDAYGKLRRRLRQRQHRSRKPAPTVRVRAGLTPDAGGLRLWLTGTI